MLFSIWHLVSPTILLPNKNFKMEHAFNHKPQTTNHKPQTTDNKQQTTNKSHITKLIMQIKRTPI